MRNDSRIALTLAALLIAVPLYRVLRPGPVSDRLLRLADRNIESLKEVSAQVRGVPVILIGEAHDRAAHHRAQLAMIRALDDRGRPLAIGLEMIQARNQAVLDRWVFGKGSEAEIREVFARDWRFPWSLYRGIFLYARDRGIPLVGLNVDEELPRQVAREGFASLSPRQKQELPPVACDVGPAYEEFIRRAHGAHAHGGSSFLHFCEAQRLWDASMAWHLARFLKSQPGYQVIVLAGSAHSWKHGIPDEVARLAGLPSRSVLLEEPGTATPALLTARDADYLWLELG